MLLQDKVAVIYGAGGAIGGAVARAFASEGATVFLTGRLQAPVEAVGRDIVSAGGAAEAAEVDALDEPAVDRHLLEVLDKAGRIDISFNAIGIPDPGILGVPLAELGTETFLLPITAYTRSYFLTAHLAAAHMIPKKSGVIMTVTALPARMGTRMNGGSSSGTPDSWAAAASRDMPAACRSASTVIGTNRTSPAVVIPVTVASASAKATAASTSGWPSRGSYQVR